MRISWYWAASWSWVGHVLGALGRRRGAPAPVIEGGVVEYRDNPVMNRLPAVAIVFGNVINYRPLRDVGTCLVRRYDDFSGAAPRVLLREHELQHIRQYRRWGPAFIPAYLVAEVAVRVRRLGGGRCVNWFERQADDGCEPRGMKGMGRKSATDETDGTDFICEGVRNPGSDSGGRVKIPEKSLKS